MNPSIVICGFPGVGKSHLFKNQNSGVIHDSDSTDFSWFVDPEKGKIRNPEFPANYISHIRGLQGVVLCSTHKEVRDALAEAGITFTVVYPGRELKEEYLQRYRDRGSPDAFVTLMDRNWDGFIDQMVAETRCVSKHVLASGEHLSAVL